MPKSLINFIEIDRDKLENEFKKRDITSYEVSQSLGASRNYFKTALRRGTLPRTVLKLLEQSYNIALDDIRPEPEPTKEPEQLELKLEPQEQPKELDFNNTVFKVELDWKKLYQTMYMASFRAFKAALEGDGEHEQI